MKYYAVDQGKKRGIYQTWEECQKVTNGEKNAVFKSFKTKREAEEFLEQKEKERQSKQIMEQEQQEIEERQQENIQEKERKIEEKQREGENQEIKQLAESKEPKRKEAYQKGGGNQEVNEIEKENPEINNKDQNETEEEESSSWSFLEDNKEESNEEENYSQPVVNLLKTNMETRLCRKREEHSTDRNNELATSSKQEGSQREGEKSDDKEDDSKCGNCDRIITNSTYKAICCDLCSKWYHSNRQCGKNLEKVYNQVKELKDQKLFKWFCITCEEKIMSSEKRHRENIRKIQNQEQRAEEREDTIAKLKSEMKRVKELLKTEEQNNVKILEEAGSGRRWLGEVAKIMGLKVKQGEEEQGLETKEVIQAMKKKIEDSKRQEKKLKEEIKQYKKTLEETIIEKKEIERTLEDAIETMENRKNNNDNNKIQSMNEKQKESPEERTGIQEEHTQQQRVTSGKNEESSKTDTSEQKREKEQTNEKEENKEKKQGQNPPEQEQGALDQGTTHVKMKEGRGDIEVDITEKEHPLNQVINRWQRKKDGRYEGKENNENKICIWHNKGFCKFGDQCRFKHIKICSTLTNGKPCQERDKCQYSHDRSIICRYKECTKRECKFIHMEKKPNQNRQQAKTQRKNTIREEDNMATEEKLLKRLSKVIEGMIKDQMEKTWNKWNFEGEKASFLDKGITLFQKE